MSWLLQWEEELSKLDELLALLAKAPPSPECEIAKEHIQSARSCVLGAMPAECELDLQLARTAIGGHCRCGNAAQCSKHYVEFAVQFKILTAAIRRL